MRFLEFGSGLIEVIFCLFKVVQVLVWHFFMLYWLALTVGKAIEFWGSFAAGDGTEYVRIAVLIFWIGFEDGCLGFI
jgi:hypothetical protein